LLLHLVDAAPLDDSDPVAQARAIVEELASFSQTLAEKERWLVLNKADLIDEEDLQVLKQRFVDELGWDIPVYQIAAINGEGCQQLCHDVMRSVERHRQQLLENDDFRAAQKTRDQQMEFEIRRSIENTRKHRVADDDDLDDFDDFDDDDDGVTVVYE
jgi:GTPase